MGKRTARHVEFSAKDPGVAVAPAYRQVPIGLVHVDTHGHLGLGVDSAALGQPVRQHEADAERNVGNEEPGDDPGAQRPCGEGGGKGGRSLALHPAVLALSVGSQSGGRGVGDVGTKQTTPMSPPLGYSRLFPALFPAGNSLAIARPGPPGDRLVLPRKNKFPYVKIE